MTVAAISLALAASLCYGIGDFLGGFTSRRVPLIAVLFGSQAVGALALVPGVLAGGFGQADARAYVWGAIGGVATAGAMACLYRALAIGTMGVVAPITALSVTVPVIAGFASGERPAGIAIAGLVLAVVGTVAASGPELRRGEASGLGAAPIVLAVGAAIGLGVVTLSVARGSQSDVTVTVFVSAVVALAVYGGAAIVRRVRLWPGRRAALTIAAIGLVGIAASLLYGYATTHGPLTIVSVLAALYPAVTALLAWLVLKEHLTRLQLAGVAAILLGVAVVTIA